MVKVPRRFYDDHVDRGCGETDRLVSVTMKHYVIELDEAGYVDLLGDADYYVDMLPELDRCYFGLVASARATLKILRASGGPR